MTIRNDLETAHARIESLERETRALAEQNALLNARLEEPPTLAKPTPPPSIERERAQLKTAETSDETVTTWPVTVLVAMLAIATAVAVMFAGNT